MAGNWQKQGMTVVDPGRSQVGRTHAEPDPKIKYRTAATVPSSKGVLPQALLGQGAGRMALVRRLRTGDRTIPKAANARECGCCMECELPAPWSPVIAWSRVSISIALPESVPVTQGGVCHYEPSRARRALETRSYSSVSESKRVSKVQLSSSRSIPVSLGAMRGCQSAILGKRARPSISFWAPGGAASNDGSIATHGGTPGTP